MLTAASNYTSRSSIPSNTTTVLDNPDSAVSNTPGSKKRKLIDTGGDDLADGEVGFKINEEYARRFEHNKKREELQRCKSTEPA